MISVIHRGINAFVVVMYRHGQNLFRIFLTDDIGIEVGLDFHGLERGGPMAHFIRRLISPLILDYFIAEFDTFITDEYIRTGDEFLHLILIFAAE